MVYKVRNFYGEQVVCSKEMELITDNHYKIIIYTYIIGVITYISKYTQTGNILQVIDDLVRLPYHFIFNLSAKLSVLKALWLTLTIIKM